MSGDSSVSRTKRRHSETVSDVFKSTGQPTITYVARDSGALEGQIKNALKSPGRLVVVTGPSKTGKTTLYKRVCKDLLLVPLVVRCDRNLGVHDFWARALEQINFSRIKEVTAEQKLDSKVGGSFSAKLGWAWLAQATGIISTEVSSGTSEQKARELVLSNPSPMHLVPVLKNLPYVLVVEDYHYLADEVQETIFQQWKVFVDEEVTALVLGTSHHAVDVISANRELVARLLHVEVGSWSEEDLGRIISQGFEYLEVSIAPAEARKIVRESVGLPIVTQLICEQIFHRNAHYTHIKGTSVDTGSRAIDHALETTAKGTFSTFKQHYDRLIVGPRKRARKFDTYELVISCFSLEPIVFSLQKHEIIERLQRLPIQAERRPPLGSVNSMLRALMAFQKRNSNELLEWQETEEKLYILEPCFLFFLRWGLGNQRQEEIRELIREMAAKPSTWSLSRYIDPDAIRSASGTVSKTLERDMVMLRLLINLLEKR